MGHYRSEMMDDDADKELAQMRQIRSFAARALNAQASVNEILGQTAPDPREECYKFLGSTGNGYFYGHMPCGQVVFDRDTHLMCCPANPAIEEDPL